MPKEKSDELSDLSSSASGSESGSEEEKPKPKKQKTEAKAEKKGKEKSAKKSGPTRGDNGEYMFELAPLRFVTVSEFKGRTFVGIREFYEKDGKKLPGKKGISLTPDQWKRLKDSISDIDECLENF